MINYAEMLGIDLAKLEAERYQTYVTRNVTRDITPPPESTDDWQKLAYAANKIGYSVQTLRRWIDKGKIRYNYERGRLWVYMPDLERHAHNPKP